MSTTKGWGVQLLGHGFDLQDWRDTLKAPFDPWIDQRDDRYFLRTTLFDEAVSATEVRDRAFPIVEKLNAAKNIAVGSQSVRFDGGVAEFDADGRLRVHVILAVGAAVMRSRAHAPTVTLTIDGAPAPSPPPKESQVQRWAAISERHELLADALTYHSRAEWFDIYKAIECLEDWLGGEQDLRNQGWIKAGDPRD